MERLLTLGWSRHRAVLTLAAALSLLALPFAFGVRVDVSSELLWPADSASRQAHERVRAVFEDGSRLAVVAQDDALLERDRLRALRELDARLGRLPGVQRVESAFGVWDLHTVDDALRIGPPLAEIPDDAEEVARLAERLRANPLLRGHLLGADGRSLALVLHLADTADARALATDAQRLVDEAAPGFAQLDLVGGPVVDVWVRDQLASDQLLLVPLVLLVVYLVLARAMRGWLASALPMAGSTVAVVVALGVLGATDVPLNLLSAVLPVLVLVVGASEDVHVVSDFRARLFQGRAPDDAMRDTAQAVTRAVLLSAVTTLMGFGSAMLAGLPLLQDFGLTALLALGLRVLVTLFVIPASMRLCASRIVPAADSDAGRRRAGEHLGRWIATRLGPHPRLVALGMLALAAFSVAAVRDLDRDNDLLSFLDPETELALRTERAAAALSGTDALHVVVEGDFDRVEDVERLDALGQALREVDGVDAVLSFADVVRRALHQLHAGDPAWDRVPETDAGLRQMLLLAQPGDLSALVSPDEHKAHVVLRTRERETEALLALANAVGAVVTAHFGAEGGPVTGPSLTSAAATEEIVWTQVRSLGAMAAALFAVVALLFLSLRCAALVVAVNMWSALMVFGIMGAAGLPLNVGTCMVAAITLGLAVNDTLHLLVRFNTEIRDRRDEVEGIVHGLAHQLSPILATTAALAAGLAVLGLSSFTPVRQFGLLSAAALALALLADVFLVPALLGNLRIVTLWDLLGLDVRTALLRQSPFFRGLRGWNARRVILATHLEEHAAGETIVREGERGDTMYVVVDGELEVTVAPDAADGPPRVVATLGPGDVFGEAGFVATCRRTADVTTRHASRLLALDATSFVDLRRFSPWLAAQLLENIARILGSRLATSMEGHELGAPGPRRALEERSA